MRAKGLAEIFVLWGISLCAVAGVCDPVSIILQDTQSESASSFKGLSKGRLEISPLKQPLRLEETAEIPLVLHGFAINVVRASWRYDETSGKAVPRGDSEEVVIKYHPDGTAYVNFTPEGLGKVNFAVTIYFEDGYIETERLDAEVILPERKPESIYAMTGVGNESSVGPGTIYMDLSGRSHSRELDFKALYKGAAHSVPIPLKLATFKIISADESNSPIDFNATTGVITALHIGHALVQATFEGATTLVCVDVQEDATEGSDRTVCPELVPEGMTGPKSGFENFPPQAPSR
jgi:hypothetical protein